VQYPPEVIGAAIKNASAHFASRWRIVPLWILQKCQDNPSVPRIYIASFGAAVVLVIVVRTISALFGHHDTTSVPGVGVSP
jgi:hypothetical protein